MTFEETMKKAKDSLQTLLTADNTEAVTGIVADLDSLNAEYKKRGEKIGELQETVVKYVRSTSFGTPSGDDSENGGTKSIDDLISDSLEKSLKNKKKRGKKKWQNFLCPNSGLWCSPL